MPRVPSGAPFSSAMYDHPSSGRFFVVFADSTQVRSLVVVGHSLSGPTSARSVAHWWSARGTRATFFSTMAEWRARHFFAFLRRAPLLIGDDRNTGA